MTVLFHHFGATIVTVVAAAVAAIAGVAWMVFLSRRIPEQPAWLAVVTAEHLKAAAEETEG